MRKDKPAITLRDIKTCLRMGYAFLSIDRELHEYLRNFVNAGLGEFMELKGFVLARGDRMYLRMGLGIHIEVELEGLDPRVAKAVVGEPVVIQGFKVGKRKFRVERIAIRSIVKARPYADFEYLKNVVLNGVELETPEELATLCLISSPRVATNLCGGARQAVLGNKRSYFDAKLRKLTISVRSVWKFGKVGLDRVSLIEKAFRRYAEVSADIDGGNNVVRIANIKLVDFPTVVKNAPRESTVDLDAIDYTLWVKGLRPRIGIDKLSNLLERISARLTQWLLKEGISSLPPALSIDFEARPSTVLRLAMALARVRGLEDPTLFISEAQGLVEKALEKLLEAFSKNPKSIVKLKDLEKAVLKTLERFEPMGASIHDLAKSMSIKNIDSLLEVLEKLRRKGLVYCPRPGVYRVTPL